ncbi:MAG: hypothetical protein E7E32_00300 [Anaerococcus hydrogenalis]|nr:hypothetical protein [Anaerococcus hydrogenalis]
MMAIPIIFNFLFNGITILVINKVIENRIKKIEKQQNIRDENLLLFHKKIQELNKIMVKLNSEFNNDSYDDRDIIIKLNSKVLDILITYENNYYDLEQFSNSLNKWSDLGMDFNNELSFYLDSDDKTKNKDMLKTSLKKFKNQTLNLLNEVRVSYS